MCKVSVIIPVYNRINELMISVNSIINQSFKDWEMILVDDGSTDGTSELCNQIALRDKRIRIFHQMNAGVSAARNYGLSMARGKYILFLDSDDWIENDTIERLVSKIEFEQSDIVLFAMSIDRFSGNKINTSTKLYGQDTVITKSELINRFVDLFYKDYLASSCTKLFKKSIIEDNKLCFKENLVMYEDFYFVMDYLSNIDYISISNYPFYHYRMDENIVLIEKRKSDSLLENLDIIANRVLEFVANTQVYNDDKLQKIVFEFYIMYIYKLFLSKQFSLIYKWKELKRIIKIKNFQIVEKRSRGTDEGKFYKILRFAIRYKLVTLMLIACSIRYRK